MFFYFLHTVGFMSIIYLYIYMYIVFDLISLFNDILTIVCYYVMPNPSFKKNSSGII